ncbi:MAG: thioredoxin [Anaerolineales bacterium]|jgi:thioredoxin 1
MANIVEISDDNFEREVLQVKGAVLVDFGAEWCKPCKQLDPIVEELAQEWGDRVKVVKIDSDANVDTTSRYTVMGLPTLILFVDGEPVERMMGFKPRPKIEAMVDPHLAN